MTHPPTLYTFTAMSTPAAIKPKIKANLAPLKDGIIYFRRNPPQKVCDGCPYP